VSSSLGTHFCLKSRSRLDGNCNLFPILNLESGVFVVERAQEVRMLLNFKVRKKERGYKY